MRIWIGLAALLATGGTASATVVQPALGVTATEAEVGALRNFHVLSGTGTPGTNVPDYNPAAYFGTTSSAVSAVTTGVDNNGKNPTNATASAAVDLASGQMHVVANSERRQGTGLNNNSVAYTSASGVMSDTIHIAGAITGPVTIRISMTVDGSITGSAGATALHSGLATFALRAGSKTAQVTLNQFDGAYVQEVDQSTYGGKVVLDSGNAASLTFTLYDDVVVTDTNRAISFVATASLNPLTADQPGTITADFGNTARLAVSLPTGLSFTSDSGVFLTAPQDATTDVPEPASFALLASGLLGLLGGRGYTRSGTASTRSRVAASSSSR